MCIRDSPNSSSNYWFTFRRSEIEQKSLWDDNFRLFIQKWESVWTNDGLFWSAWYYLFTKWSHIHISIEKERTRLIYFQSNFMSTKYSLIICSYDSSVFFKNSIKNYTLYQRAYCVETLSKRCKETSSWCHIIVMRRHNVPFADRNDREVRMRTGDVAGASNKQPSAKENVVRRVYFRIWST